jgi:hypothetical protein
MTNNMQLPFDPDQAIYDAWYEFHMKRATDPNEAFDYVDLNDGVMVFCTAHVLYQTFPDKVELLREHTPTAVARAMDDLGIFMGVTYLAGKVGIDPEIARKAVFSLWATTEGS